MLRYAPIACDCTYSGMVHRKCVAVQPLPDVRVSRLDL